MKLLTHLSEMLLKEQTRLSNEITELEKQRDAIATLLGYHEPEPTEEEFVPHRAVRKVNLAQELRVFCNGRKGQNFTIRNFATYLTSNFGADSFRVDSARQTLLVAAKAGEIRVVKPGSRGNMNPTVYQVL